MKIQALGVQLSKQVVAYCNQKMQVCRMEQMMGLDRDNISLSVSTSNHYQSPVLRVIRFRKDTLVEMAC